VGEFGHSSRKRKPQAACRASLVAMQKARRSAAAGDNSHKSETRISAILDFALECKQKKKALPLFPLTLAVPPSGPGRRTLDLSDAAHHH